MPDLPLADRTQLVGRQRDHSKRLTVQGHELHFIAADGVDQHDRADVTSLEAVLRQIVNEDYAV
jgi:hypothetical protein